MMVTLLLAALSFPGVVSDWSPSLTVDGQALRPTAETRTEKGMVFRFGTVEWTCCPSVENGRLIVTSEIANRGTSEIWVSNNIPNCDEHNKPIHDKYRHRVHHLYPVW